MGYAKINNLYKDQTLLEHDEVYALEKIHGTSAHIAFNKGNINFYAGGMKHELFISIFQNHPVEWLLRNKLSNENEVVIYGEAYGGSMQRMQHVYGDKARFIAFDVKYNGIWLNVPDAHSFCTHLQLEFVDYVKIPTKLSLLDEERDKHSVQAIRNGVGEGKPREGVVLRPLQEGFDRRGNRLIAKHKNAQHNETKTQREVDPTKLVKLKEAKAIAEEWVTEMRLDHVLDKCLTPEQNETLDMSYTPIVIRAVLADIKKESEREIEWSKDAEREVCTLAARLFKQRVTKINDK